MMKNLLLTLAIASSLIAGAQNHRKSRTLHTGSIEPATETAAKSQLPPTCFTITTITSSVIAIEGIQTDTSVPNCTLNTGYLFGSNCYGDLEKANFYAGSNYTNGIASPSVSMVKVGFFKNGNFGTSGTTAAINMSIYSGSLSSGPAGAALGTATATAAQILAAQGGTNNFHFYYTYTLSTPVAVPLSGFFASVKVPTTAGDTAVIFTQSVSANNYCWERETDNNWYDMGIVWSGLKGNMDMYPTICGNTVATTVSSNSGISKNVSMMPNPTSGEVNINVNLMSNENIEITVTNVLGQVIRTHKQEMMHTNVAFSLAEEPNGIYFVTVSNGKDKMVQRLILNK